MRQAILSIAILAVSLSRLLAAEMPVPIRHSAPMKGGQGLGTKGYVPLEDEESFLKKVIPPLGLICAYGPVAAVAAMAIVKAEYVRVWDWGLFTFMDYGQDKSNAKWVKLRKVDEDEVYSPRPSLNYYIQRLGPREEIER